jgi:hypothetical protein
MLFSDRDFLPYVEHLGLEVVLVAGQPSGDSLGP